MNFNKRVLIVITIFYFISIIISFLFVNCLDKYESDGFDHQLIKGDIYDIWDRGKKFKDDLVSGKNFFMSGTEIYRSYLPPRLIGLFSIIFNYEIIINVNESAKITLGFKKFYYLLFQSIFFYLVLFWFWKKFSKYINNNSISFNTITFLCLCPNIFLYNSMFHTESIFFSLQILLLTLLIAPLTKFFYSFFIGLVLILLFLQKTVAVFYIIIVVIYLTISLGKNSIKPNIIILLTYIFFLFIIGHANFKRIGVFYFMPTQGNEAIYHYLVHPILTKGYKISGEDASSKMKADLAKWKIENKITDDKSEKNRIKIFKFKSKYTQDLMMQYPITTLKIISWKMLQTGILNPMYIFHYNLYEQDLSRKPQYYLEKTYTNFWIPKQIIYSILIYSIILIGFVNSIKVLDIKYNLLLFSSALYMFFMLGWVGNSRYFSTSLIYLSVYFGFGINYLTRCNFNIFAKVFKKN